MMETVMDCVQIVINNIVLKKTAKRRIEFSETESDDEDDIIILKNQTKHTKIKNFVKNTMLHYSLSDFRKHFRISKSSFKNLLHILETETMGDNIRRPAYAAFDSLLLTLWALSNHESFRQLGDRFNVSEGHAHGIFVKYCIKLSHVHKQFIVWPRNELAIGNRQKFNTLRGERSFPNVFGCIDGSHIAIPGPTHDNSYYNRKGYHSIHIQAICDAQERFINIFCGWPGSVHDARVWKACNIYKELQENPSSLLPPNTYLLGDSAYPLSKYLLVPFKDNGHLTQKQKRFNAALSSTRVVIEQAFGRLKGLFRRLKYLHVLNISYAKYAIIAACVLHNIAIDDKQDNEELIFEKDEEQITDIEENITTNVSIQAVQFRNEIMNKYF